MGYIRYTKILFHGISSSDVAGNLPYFKFIFYTLTSIPITNFHPNVFSKTSTIFYESFFLSYPLLGDRYSYNFNLLRNFGVLMDNQLYPKIL